MAQKLDHLGTKQVPTVRNRNLLSFRTRTVTVKNSLQDSQHGGESETEAIENVDQSNAVSHPLQPQPDSLGLDNGEKG